MIYYNIIEFDTALGRIVNKLTLRFDIDIIVTYYFNRIENQR
jgi:uncharacterized membrane protein